MSDVSVLGTGLMGSALARAFLTAGHKVTVWSRTAARTQTLIAAGAERGGSAAEAFGASPLSIICVRDYEAAQSFMDSQEASKALSGKTLLQLSTGTSLDARKAEVWAQRIGCSYLDGKIMSYPEGIGQERTLIYVSGSSLSFERHKQLLSALGGRVSFVGEGIGLSATLDAAHLMKFFGHVVGFTYGMALCEREGYPIDRFVTQAIDGMPPIVSQTFGRMSEIVQQSRFGDAEATVATMESALGTIARDFREGGLNDEFPALLHALFKRAEVAGFGQEDSAALIKLLRRAGP